MTPSMHPDPGLIFAELRLFERSAALKAAIDLELFTHIDDGSTTPREMAAKTGASERGIRILCDFLTVYGHLTKFGESYGLTMNSQLFLSKRSPSYVGSIADFLVSEQQSEAMWHVDKAVRNGGSLTDTALAPDSPMWAVFARGMAPMMRAFSGAAIPHVVSGNAPMKILDIAAGHGLWGITALQLNPSAEVTGQDWPTVLEVAKENARKASVSDRYHTLPGSAFDVNFGTGWDLILEPNFAHHCSVADNVKLFKKIHAALRPGGRIAVIEFVPNEDRVSPPMAASFALTMLAGTPEGDVYTFSEYSRMLETAGFHGAKLIELAPLPQRLITAEA